MDCAQSADFCLGMPRLRFMCTLGRKRGVIDIVCGGGYTGVGSMSYYNCKASWQSVSSGGGVISEVMVRG